MHRRIATRFAALSLLLVLASFVATPVSAAPGNSGNAHACQDGGWQSLAPAEDPTSAFANQGDCVSYGAHGGQIVPLAVYNPSITVTMIPAGDHRCAAQVVATGFLPNTQYPVLPYLSGDLSEYSVSSATTDSNGNLSFPSMSFLETEWYTYAVQIGDVMSEAVPYVC